MPRNRAHGAGGQNRSCLIKWAAKQEKFQPKEMCFSLTSTFIELYVRRPLEIVQGLPSGRQPARTPRSWLVAYRAPFSPINGSLRRMFRRRTAL